MRKVMVNAVVKMSFVALSSFTLLAASPSAVAASTQLADNDGPGVQQQVPAQSGSGAPIQHIPGNAGTGDAATASGSKSKGTKKDTKDTTGDGTGDKTKGATGSKTTGASKGTKDTTGDGTGNASAGGSMNTGGKSTKDTTGDGTGNATAGGSMNTGASKVTGDTTGDGTGNATGGATGPNTAGKDTGDTTGDGTGNATGGASVDTAGDDDAVGSTGNDQGVTTVNVQTNGDGTVVVHTETTTFANGSRIVRVFNNGVLVREVSVPAGAAIPNGVLGVQQGPAGQGNTGTTPTNVAGQQAAPSLAMLPATSTAAGAPAGILGASIALAGAWLLRRGRKA